MNSELKAFKPISEFAFNDSIEVFDRLEPQFFLSSEDDLEVRLGGRVCSDSVKSAILSKADVPSEGWVVRHPDIGLSIVEDFVKKLPAESVQALIFEDVVVKVASTKVNIIRPSAVAERIVEAVNVDRFRMFGVGSGMEFEFIGNEAMNPVGITHDSFAGIYVQVDGKIRISSMVLTQICINGLTGRAFIPGEFNVESVREAYKQSLDLCKSLISLFDRKIEDAAASARGILSLLRLPNNSRAFGILMKKITDKRPENMYELIQSVTSCANEMSREGRPNRQLQTIGELVPVWAGIGNRCCNNCQRPWSL